MAESLSLTVVVPSHAPLRLPWLLNSLENPSWGEPWKVIASWVRYQRCSWAAAVVGR